MPKLLNAFRLSLQDRFVLDELCAARGKNKTEIVSEALLLYYSSQILAVIQQDSDLLAIIHEKLNKTVNLQADIAKECVNPLQKMQAKGAGQSES